MKADCFYIHVYCVLRECHLIAVLDTFMMSVYNMYTCSCACKRTDDLGDYF